MFKRLFDILFSFMGFIIIFPLFLLIAFLIKIDSRGPVFYSGERIGRFGKPFRMFKFRTMIENAEGARIWSTSVDDDRITKIGKVLRGHNLDELPQLINVLRGEMSLVGPRPQVSWAVELYNQEERAILNVRPGMTDYASIKFNNLEGEILRGSKSPDKDYMEKINPQKLKLELEYVKNHSPFSDFKILLETFKILFKH